MTEHNPTELDTPDTAAETPETNHPSFVDNGADELEPAEDAAEDTTQTDAESDEADSAPEAAPQTGLGDEPDEADATSPVGEADEAVPASTSAEGEEAGAMAAAEEADAPGSPEGPETAADPADSADGDSAVPADDESLEDHLPPGQKEVPVGDEVVIDDETMRRALEAILMVTDEPLPVLTLARAVGRPTGDVAAALGTLAEEYTEQGRGFDLREVGGGWRYYTRVDAAPYVERFVLDGQQARLTQAALETLAVVAYKQPVSRARVSAIRGVNVDGVMRTLIARGLVEEAGADTESQATLYRTTSYFLERMGMQSLDDLPELAPYLPDMDDIEDELAAQTLPPATPEEPTEAPTAEATPAEANDESEPKQAPTDAPADAEHEPAETDDLTEADGIDGLTEAQDETAEAENELSDDEISVDEGEPAEADEQTESEDETAEAADEPAEDQPAQDQPAGGDTGIDGDLSTDEPVELDVEHEPGELVPSEEVGSTGEPELSRSGDRQRDE